MFEMWLERIDMQVAGLLGMLGICSYEDIKSRKIGVVMVLLFAIFGVITRLLLGSPDIRGMFGGMILGGALFVLGRAFKGSLGSGDALMVMVSGIYLGFWNNLVLLWIASFLTGILGIVLILMGKRNKEIPFAPFLLVAYLVLLILEGGTNVS